MSAFIPLQEGIAMTKAYREKRDAMIKAGSISSDFLPLCETFQKDEVLTLLGKTGCAGLRIYLGLEEEKINLILVGVNTEDADMIPQTNQAARGETDGDDDDDDLLDRGVRCPTSCPPASGLNS